MMRILPKYTLYFTITMWAIILSLILYYLVSFKIYRSYEVLNSNIEFAQIYFDIKEGYEHISIRLMNTTGNLVCQSNEKFVVEMIAVNQSDKILSSGSEHRTGPGQPVNIGYRIYDSLNDEMLYEGPRTFLGKAFHGLSESPTNEVMIPVQIDCPTMGTYFISIEFVQEDVGWQSSLSTSGFVNKIELISLDRFVKK